MCVDACRWRCGGRFLLGVKRKSHLTISTSKRIKSRIVEAPDVENGICSNTQLESWRVQCYKLFCCYMAATPNTRSFNKFPPISSQRFHTPHIHNIYTYTYVSMNISGMRCKYHYANVDTGKCIKCACVCAVVVNRVRHVSYSVLFILFYSKHLLLVLYKHARMQQKWLCH